MSSGSIETVIPAPIEIAVEPPPSGPSVEVITGVGLRGPRGPGGADSGVSLEEVAYRHVQGAASDTWVIVHGLAYKPNVTVVDGAGSRIFGDEDHSVPGQVTVRFLVSFSGEAYAS